MPLELVGSSFQSAHLRTSSRTQHTHVPEMAKAMRAAMKARKAMKKSVIAKGKRAKVSVFRGTKLKTQSGIFKKDLMRNSQGKIVSRKASQNGKKRYANIRNWIQAVSKARKALGLKGFVGINGETAQGRALYARARSFYSKWAPKTMLPPRE